MRKHYRINNQWPTPNGSAFKWEHVSVEVLMDIRDELQRLCRSVESLGADGIHGLIRMAAKEHRRREQVVKARAKAKRKAKKAKRLRVVT